MNNEEARFLLTAYRPGGQDANDPAMTEALAQARSDPALQSWFERKLAHDAAVARKLGEIAPPSGLREAILAGVRLGHRTQAPSRPALWRRTGWRVAAAALVVLGSAAAWRLRPAQGGTLDEYAVDYVARGFMLQQRSADLAALKSWLQEHGGPPPASLPDQFAALRGLGCRTLRYRDKDISLVCFEREGKEFHVFVARREDFPGRPLEVAPHLHAEERLVAAAWSDQRNHYVLVSDASLPDVRKLL